jgi:type I restriction-modification system DNA methylase subunit
VILVGALVIVIILIVILFCVYTKRAKKKITKQIAIQKRRDSDRYDDIEFPTYSMRNDVYNSYEDVKEYEAGYADNYRVSGTDLVQTPQINENQSTDDYLILSNATSPYVQMESQPKPMPRTSIKDNNRHIYYNN